MNHIVRHSVNLICRRTQRAKGRVFERGKFRLVFSSEGGGIRLSRGVVSDLRTVARQGFLSCDFGILMWRKSVVGPDYYSVSEPTNTPFLSIYGDWLKASVDG